MWVAETKLAESFMSLGVIVPMPLAFFKYRFLKRFLTSSLTVLKENLSLSET